MNIGMMWFSPNHDLDLKTKIEQALTYYARKYEQKANTVMVNPSMLENDVKVEGIEIRANRSVLPSHFWIGVNQ